jgi:hypothetical protein
MLVVVGVVSVFVYALIPFRSQDTARLGGAHSTASPANSALSTPSGSNAVTGSPGTSAPSARGVHRPPAARSGSSSSAHAK